MTNIVPFVSMGHILSNIYNVWASTKINNNRASFLPQNKEQLSFGKMLLVLMKKVCRLIWIYIMYFLVRKDDIATSSTILPLWCHSDRRITKNSTLTTRHLRDHLWKTLLKWVRYFRHTVLHRLTDRHIDTHTVTTHTHTHTHTTHTQINTHTHTHRHT